MLFLSSREFLQALAIFVLCLIISLGCSFYFGNFSSGFSGGDEGAHFVNSFFIWRFLGDMPFFDPLQYAREFYFSYPVFSIGLWPPLYYLAVGLLFFVLPATPESAMAVNLFVTTLPVLVICWLILRIAAWPWALAAGVLYALSPLVQNQTSFFMLDFPVALLCLLAALTWQGYANAKSRAMLWGLAYGVVALAAVMVKGSGWLLGLFPLFHILFNRDWRLLRAAPTYLGTIPVIAIAGPWYLLSTKLSAEGFMYSSGLDYAIEALTFNLGVLAGNVSIPGLILALAGVLLSLRTLSIDSRERQLVTVMASLILATLTFQSLLPVALVNRYMTPAHPALIVLVILGLRALIRLPWINRLHSMPRRIFTILSVASLLVPGLMYLKNETAQRDLRMDDAAAYTLEQDMVDIIVIDTSDGASGEHDFVAAMLSAGRAGPLNKEINIVRGSKFLSTSDRMGNKYKLSAETPGEVGKLLLELGANIIVINRFDGDEPYPHNLLLQDYLASDDSAYYLARQLEHGYRTGTTFIYFSSNHLTPNLEKARSVNKPPSF